MLTMEGETEQENGNRPLGDRLCSNILTPGWNHRDAWMRFRDVFGGQLIPLLLICLFLQGLELTGIQFTTLYSISI